MVIYLVQCVELVIALTQRVQKHYVYTSHSQLHESVNRIHVPSTYGQKSVNVGREEVFIQNEAQCEEK